MEKRFKQLTAENVKVSERTLSLMNAILELHNIDDMAEGAVKNVCVDDDMCDEYHDKMIELESYLGTLAWMSIEEHLAIADSTLI